jgi:hypothetical protein
MSDPVPPQPHPNSSGGFDSRDCVDLMVDLIGDTTVRPIRPSLLKSALAERERIARWQAQANPTPPPSPPAEGIDPQQPGPNG